MTEKSPLVLKNIVNHLLQSPFISLSCLNHYNIHIFFGIKKDQKTCIIFLNKNNCEQEQKGINTWIFFFINFHAILKSIPNYYGFSIIYIDCDFISKRGLKGAYILKFCLHVIGRYTSIFFIQNYTNGRVFLNIKWIIVNTAFFAHLAWVDL
jgi:hypothetical protein